MSAPIPLVAVIGPTGVGKTTLAIQLAQRFDGEVVNSDSRQVYLGMDIGTAKPTVAEQRAARHHLIDIRAPNEPLSLGEYLPLARQAISDITGRGKLPILCGGTGQYVWALLEGWQAPEVPPDPAYRAELERRAQVEGANALWRELNALDPERAESIGPQNVRRIIRALEIIHATGEKVAATLRSSEPPYNALTVGLTADRSVLYNRIDARFDAMMSDGLMEEARRLQSEGYILGEGPLSGVGYSQLGAYLSGNMSLDEAVDRAKTQTHRLVRRQYTWFKLPDRRIVWLDATRELPVAEAVRIVADFRSG